MRTASCYEQPVGASVTHKTQRAPEGARCSDLPEGRSTIQLAYDQNECLIPTMNTV
jgi:hypothetical protein